MHIIMSSVSQTPRELYLGSRLAFNVVMKDSLLCGVVMFLSDCQNRLLSYPSHCYHSSETEQLSLLRTTGTGAGEDKDDSSLHELTQAVSIRNTFVIMCRELHSLDPFHI